MNDIDPQHDRTVPEPRESEEEIETGLKPFSDTAGEGGLATCDKCGGDHVRIVFHTSVFVVLGGDMPPCAELMSKGLLHPSVTEHLCMKCQRCGFGWAMETSDA